MDIRILGLDHIVLRAADAEALVRFYCEVLGCHEERRLPEEVGLIQLRAGSAIIDVVPLDGALGRAGGRGPSEDGEGRNVDHFCLRIGGWDEAALLAHLAKHGVEVSESGLRYGADGTGPSLYLRDPAGNTVELKGDPVEPPIAR